MSVIISFISMPAARACWGMKLVAVYLKQIDFLAFGDDVVHTHNAPASQDVVNGRGEFLYPVGQFGAEACGSDFGHLPVVFRVEVEKLVLAHHFGDRQYHRLVPCLVASVC